MDIYLSRYNNLDLLDGYLLCVCLETALLRKVEVIHIYGGQVCWWVSIESISCVVSSCEQGPGTIAPLPTIPA